MKPVVFAAQMAVAQRKRRKVKKARVISKAQRRLRFGQAQAQARSYGQDLAQRKPRKSKAQDGSSWTRVDGRR